MYDVIIIGGGVSGAASARELSRYQAKVCVLEKEEDVCCGTSKANSAIIHAGYDAASGSLMAELNVRGTEMMEGLSKELDFPYRRTGSLVVCRTAEGMAQLEELHERGISNGVKGLRILNQDEVRAMEKNVADEVIAALYAPSAGIVCPFHLNIALAENANQNGVEFQFNTEVQQIRKTAAGYEVQTNNGLYQTKCIVNAAGVYADKMHNMVSKEQLRIIPRRGEYCLLDKSAGQHISRVIFALPGKYGKGILLTPTVHGNLLLGPTSTDIDDKEGTNTTRDGLNTVLTKVNESIKNVPVREVITSFAGLRAHEENHDFKIEELNESKGFIDCAGIESPGLSSCPAIGERVAEIVQGILNLKPDPGFVGTRKGPVIPGELSQEERAKLIKKNSTYGTIICRCEMISEGEIIDAIKRPLGAKSLDGVKRRTRAGMGRCGSGFCSPRTMEILARECKTELTGVTKSGGQSYLVTGKNKEELPGGRLK